MLPCRDGQTASATGTQPVGNLKGRHGGSGRRQAAAASRRTPRPREECCCCSDIIGNLATPCIEVLFDIEVIGIKGFFDIKCSTFYIDIISFDIEVTFDVEETSISTSQKTLKTLILGSNIEALQY